MQSFVLERSLVPFDQDTRDTPRSCPASLYSPAIPFPMPHNALAVPLASSRLFGIPTERDLGSTLVGHPGADLWRNCVIGGARAACSQGQVSEFTSPAACLSHCAVFVSQNRSRWRALGLIIVAVLGSLMARLVPQPIAR